MCVLLLLRPEGRPGLSLSLSLSLSLPGESSNAAPFFRTTNARLDEGQRGGGGGVFMQLLCQNKKY